MRCLAIFGAAHLTLWRDNAAVTQHIAIVVDLGLSSDSLLARLARR